MVVAFSRELPETAEQASAGREPFAEANRRTMVEDVMVASFPSISPETSMTSFQESTLAPSLLGQNPNRRFENVVRRPIPSPLEYSFELRQQWEGVVTNVEGDEFSVVLRDLVDPAAPEFDAVLPMEEVSQDDIPLLKNGAILYWTIGYERTRTGQLKRVSNVRLRRLPAWSKADIQRVENRARELDELFEKE